MRLADKVATMARRGAPLPYLRRVAYLESHGTEYIDTVTASTLDDSSLTAKISLSKITSVRYLSGSNNNLNFAVSSDGYFQIGAVKSNVKPSVDEIYSIVLNLTNKVRSIDIGDSHTTGTLATSISEVFCFTALPYDVIWDGLRVFSYRYTILDDLIFNLIPVLDLSGRPAMYDEVRGQLFYNQGTGEFTWGELNTASEALSSEWGGGTKCLRSYSRSYWSYRRFCASSARWEVAA